MVVHRINGAHLTHLREYQRVGPSRMLKDRQGSTSRYDQISHMVVLLPAVSGLHASSSTCQQEPQGGSRFPFRLDVGSFPARVVACIQKPFAPPSLGAQRPRCLRLWGIYFSGPKMQPSSSSASSPSSARSASISSLIRRRTFFISSLIRDPLLPSVVLHNY